MESVFNEKTNDKRKRVSFSEDKTPVKKPRRSRPKKNTDDQNTDILESVGLTPKKKDKTPSPKKRQKTLDLLHLDQKKLKLPLQLIRKMK